MTRWLRKIPYIGQVAYCFWFTAITAGIKDNFGKAGAMSFSFLNDGQGKPKLWLLWANMTNSSLAGIYIPHAPKKKPQEDNEQSS